MDIQNLSINSRPQKYKNYGPKPEELYEALQNCEAFEKELAEAYNIPLDKNWKEALKKQLNVGYGSNNRAGKNYQLLPTTDELYNMLVSKSSEDIIYILITHYGGPFAGATKLAEDIKQHIIALKGGSPEVTVKSVKGDIDEYIASYLRGIQYKSGKVGNTQSNSYSYAQEVVFDIEQKLPDIGKTIKWENKKGISNNYLSSNFHFGTYSAVEAFMNNNDEAFQMLRDAIVEVIYQGSIDILSNTGKKAWKYKCEAYIRLALRYIKWRLASGDVLFTNSQGDINLGSEIIEGFINHGKLGIEAITDYSGNIKDKKLNEIDERYIASWQEEAKKHKDEISEKVIEKLNKATGNRIKISIWYGNTNKEG